MINNPAYKNYTVLGQSAVQWQAIKDAINAQFAANPDKQGFADATVRGWHAALADDRVWNEIRREMGL